jgi:5-hydroxyisourate hydrolase
MKKILLVVLVLLFSVIKGYCVEVKHQLSTHILDISKGVGAPLVEVQLFKKVKENNTWVLLDTKKTDSNGRIKEFLLLGDGIDNKGIYKLVFLVAEYFKGDTFYPEVDVVFEIRDDSHYHVPITISNFGYSTYRGN